VPEDSVFKALLILDAWEVGNSCSEFGSTGADIDAVQLFQCPQQDFTQCQSIAFFNDTRALVGAQECANNYQDPDAALGEVDGGFIALQGGFVAGEFGSALTLKSGMVLRVHEYGAVYGGGDDPYSVFLMTNLDCLDSEDIVNCSLYLGEGNGLGDFIVP